LCGVLAAYPVPGGGSFSGFLLVGAILASASFGVTLVLGWEELLPWTIGVLGALYTGSLYAPGGASVGAAPLYGAGLLLLGELTAWSLSLRTRMREEPAVLLLRLATIAGAVVGSAVVGVALVALATANSGGGVAWTLLGTAAVMAAVGLVVRAARAS
jgi:hypothetical protein